LITTDVTEKRLLGDRAYALRDTSDGKIANSKNPRKWPNLFDYWATLTGAVTAGEKLPPARITLPDGTTINTEQPDAARILSAALKRAVRLEKIERNLRDAATSKKETPEEYWLDMEGLDLGRPHAGHRDGGALGHHRPLRALCDDHSRAGGSLEGSGNPAHGGPA
jgi:uncharacterized protein